MGYIKLNRSILDWEWYNDMETFKVFVHLLLKANYCDKEWHGIIVHRGEYVTSISRLSEEVQQTNQQTRTTLNKLKSTHEITIKSTNKYSIITICNYARYQGEESTEQQAKQQAEQQAKNDDSNKQSNKQTNNNIRKKEYNKEKDISKDISKKKFSFRDKLKESNVEQDLIDDFMKVRKAKGAVDTEMAWKGFIAEVQKAGITITQACECVVENSWRGFKAEWYLKQKSNGNNQQSNFGIRYDEQTMFTGTPKTEW